MGANQVDLAYAFGLPPERAIRYFETLGYTVPTDWPQRMQQAAAKAQTIAGIYRQDVVADIHRALGESAAKGTPFAKFRDAVERQLTAKGLHLDQAGDMVDTATGELLGKGITPQRLEVIYRTNMQNAYMAGRWQELQDNRAAMPYLQYTAVMDNRTRPLHRELHGQVYHIDDPFWDTFYPPNGFNCRCTVTAYSAADLTRRGLEVADSEGRLEEVYRVVNKAGDTEPTRAIRLADGRSFMADRGFDGNVGKRHLAQLGQLQMQRAVDLPPRLASMSVNQALDNLILRRAVADDLYQAYLRLMTANRPQNQPAFVGAVSLHTLDELARRQLPLPQSAIIASSDSLVRHAQRSVKAGVDKTLPADFWQTHGKDMESWQDGGMTYYRIRGPLVPSMLLNQFVYLEEDGGTPLFAQVREREGDRAVLRVVRDYTQARHAIWGITARNREQNFALNLLLDPDITISCAA